METKTERSLKPKNLVNFVYPSLCKEVKQRDTPGMHATSYNKIFHTAAKIELRKTNPKKCRGENEIHKPKNTIQVDPSKKNLSTETERKQLQAVAAVYFLSNSRESSEL